MPPSEGWSVSGFEEAATPEPPAPAQSTPVDDAAYPATFDSAPSFDSSDFSSSFSTSPPSPDPSTAEAPEAASEYPTDFESAFALPPGESDEQSAFSPDPTETVAPEDTASLQRTLEGVLQIRNGASASSKTGTPFGDYRLLERVAVGGMAEVWQAHRRGVEGFQKIVAIKKILSHLTGSQDFITMFIDEAKLAAQLNHTNIIQIYDLGKVEDDFFIAMEFVDGKDLRSIQNRAKDFGQKLPLGLCLMITAAVARALDYAHRKRDFDNRDLGLVHRDVSPQNVLISYEGEIKLCDFGIVKAVAKASSTQMGALKGKLQYMSPEQAWGKEVDARSDIFSLGSVFFELLTGERLFTGDSEIGVLDAVRDCRVQSPRNLDPDLPTEVEAIVMRALAPTPESRYQTAGEMEKDIAAVLEQLRPAVGQSDLAEMMARLFGPQSGSAAPPAPEIHLGLERVADDPADAKAEAAEPEAEKPPEKDKKAKGKKSKKAEDGGGSSRTWVIAAIVLIALAAVVVILFFALQKGDSTQTPPVTSPAPAIEAAPEGAATSDSLDEATGDAAAGDASSDGAADNEEASGEDSTPDEAGSETAGQSAAGQDSAAPDASEAASGEGADYQQLIQEALDSERKKLEEDFESERRRLEQELSKVRAEGEEGSEGGGG